MDPNLISITKNEIIIPKGQILIDLFDARTGELKERQFYKNLVTTAGKESVAAGIIQQTNRGFITYCALGTGITAPALGDTDLQTEIFRKQISVREVANNTITLRTFFGTSEGNGTLREAGLFGDDASSIPGSGTLFCRAAINRTKSVNDTLSFAWSVIIG